MAWCFEGEWHGQRQDIGLPMMICDLINAVNERYRIKRFFETGAIQPYLVFGESIGQSWTRPTYEDFNGLRLDLLMRAVERPLIEAVGGLLTYTGGFLWAPENAWNTENGGSFVNEEYWYPHRYRGGAAPTSAIVDPFMAAGWPDGPPSAGGANWLDFHRRDAVDRLAYCKDVLSLLRFGCLQWDRAGFWVDKNGRPIVGGRDALRFANASVAWPETMWIRNDTYGIYQEFPNGPNYVYVNPECEFIIGQTIPRMQIGGTLFTVLWGGFLRPVNYLADDVRLHLKPEFAALLFSELGEAEKLASWSVWRAYANSTNMHFETRHGNFPTWKDEYGSAETMESRAIREPDGGLYPTSPVDVFYYNWSSIESNMFSVRRSPVGAVQNVATWWDFGFQYG